MPTPAVAHAAFTAWAGGVLAVSGILLGSHLLAFPAPKDDPRLELELARHQPPGGADLTVLHVLAADCGCSRRIFEHLEERGPARGTHETIVWVDGVKGTRAPASRAFAVEHVSMEEASARFGAIGAPVMVVGDRAGKARYTGGYTTKKQGPFIADVRILDDVRHGREVRPLPIFGCAVDRETQRKLDPLGVR